MSRFHPYLQREVLAALEGLTAEGLIDFEQPLTEVKFYFPATRPPRRYVRQIPAANSVLPAARGGSWLSALGVAA